MSTMQRKVVSVIGANAGIGAASSDEIEVYADIWCPFTHVGLRRLVTARDARRPDAQIRVRAWPLEWVNGRPLAPDLVAQEIGALRSEVAPELFAGFDPTRWPRSTIPALGLAAAAYRVGNDTGEGVSLRLPRRALRGGSGRLGRGGAAALGLEFGVEPLTGPSAEAAVRADWEGGRARNVRGSPHFFVGARDWFCPSLRIRHEGTEFDISIDREALDAFYTRARSADDSGSSVHSFGVDDLQGAGDVGGRHDADHCVGIAYEDATVAPRPAPA